MRSKTSTVRKRKHKKILKLAKGYRMTRSKVYKVAKQAVLHAGQYAYHGRKLRKRDMRNLWIVRINGALSQLGHSLNYSRFINGLKKANISLNRKMLSQLAIKDMPAFKAILEKVEKA